MRLRFSHVVFDVDGTLLDTEEAVLRSLGRVAESYLGRRPEREELLFALGIPGADALKKLGIHPVDEANAFWDRLMPDYQETVRLFPGIRESLQALRQAGGRLGVVTSKTKKEYADEFSPFGLDEFFGAVVCADDTERHKPHGDPLLAYLRASGGCKEYTLYIGDSSYDMACARAAGARCALALWGCKRPEGITADFYLRTPEEIFGILTPGRAGD